jgi:chromosome segregation ATPase
MRLTKIKLAGFKSFVDPTQVSFPSNLTGVVGPNGCGKSNVIDAVRWVMGELSAKHLRGDNMADVVFNGSSARKPPPATSSIHHVAGVRTSPTFSWVRAWDRAATRSSSRA